MKITDLEQVTKKVQKDLESQLISGKLLLDRLSVIDEKSRKSPAYLDHRYAPFYYHLGKYLEANSLLEVGFNIGILSCSFLTSCKSIKEFFGFKEIFEEFIPTRIGKINIKKFVKNIKIYTGKLYDEELEKILNKKWDIILINEEKEFNKQLDYMEFFWPYLSDSGVMIVEHINSHQPSRKAVKAFCDRRDIKPIIFNTRYGTSLISNVKIN